MPGTQAVSLATRTFRPAPLVELRQRLPSRTSVISPFVEQLMRFITRFRNKDESERDIETVLREALANTIAHGSLEDSRKCLYVACRCTAGGVVSITVEDEGQDFATELVADPSTPGNRLLTEGRGIYLMKTLMDEVCFERRGAVVYMRKASNARPWAGKKKA